MPCTGQNAGRMTGTAMMISTCCVLSLCVLATALPRQSKSSSSKLDAQVIILGGGVAGISAAKTLYDGGVTDIIVV